MVCPFLRFPHTCMFSSAVSFSDAVYKVPSRGKLVLKKKDAGIDKLKKAVPAAKGKAAGPVETNEQQLDKREKLKSDKFCK